MKFALSTDYEFSNRFILNIHSRFLVNYKFKNVKLLGFEAAQS